MADKFSGGPWTPPKQAISTPTVPVQARSIQEVFSIPELLETILEFVPPLELFKLQEVNHEFNNNIVGSRRLQDTRLEAALKPSSLLLAKDSTASTCASTLLETSFSPLAQRLLLGHLVIHPFKFDTLADGGGFQRNGDKQVPELHFSLSIRIPVKETTKSESRTIEGQIPRKRGPATARINSKSDYEEYCRRAMFDEYQKNGDTIGYRGKSRMHKPDQTWSCMNMITDRKPFDIVVWVFMENENFYKHVVHFGPGGRTMRDLFDVFTELYGRSIERHRNEAQLATWYGRV